MNRYRLQFRGRKVGAIGLFHFVSIVVEAKDAAEAQLKAYETHEHITNMHITNMGPVS